MMSREKRGFGRWLVRATVLLLLVGVVGAGILAYAFRAGSSGRAWLREQLIERVRLEQPQEVVRADEGEEEQASPTSRPLAASDPVYDVRELFNGVSLELSLDRQPGESAATERQREESYRALFQFRVAEPTAATSLDGLVEVNDRLPDILPGLPELLDESVVSEYYHELYERKKERVSRDMSNLRRVLSRHNYFDCQTILEMSHPVSGRPVLWLQSGMDIVSDGSDGDRLPEMPEEIVHSSNYQPSTSYRWRKTTDTPNPLLVGWKKRLEEAEEEYAIVGLPPERNRQLEAKIDHAQRVVHELKRWSFLISDYDPFIVLPVYVIIDRSESPFNPSVGDYALVIHEGRVFPAIVGDAGPNFKVGEASLRIGREIDERTNPYRRPVSDLGVSYVIFPGTAESPAAAPDYELLYSRCKALIEEIGGLGEGYVLHKWEDLLAED